jgi:alpha-tubulin suppressor-like RCC1 family protein
LYGIKHDGSIWAWGQSPYIHPSSGYGNNKPVLISANESKFKMISGTICLREDGTIWLKENLNTNGKFVEEMIPYENDNDCKYISGLKANSVYYIYPIKNDGSLWYLTIPQALNRQSVNIQVGNKSNWEYISIAFADAYQQHYVALKTDGTLWACGNNNFGYLGIGSEGIETDKLIPAIIE